MIRVFDCLALCQHDFKLTFDTAFWNQSTFDHQNYWPCCHGKTTYLWTSM